MNEYTKLAMAGDVKQARIIRDSLDTVRNAFKGSRPSDKPHAQQKYWAELLGQVGGTVRRPLLGLSEVEKGAIKKAFEECGLKITTNTL